MEFFAGCDVLPDVPHFGANGAGKELEIARVGSDRHIRFHLTGGAEVEPPPYPMTGAAVIEQQRPQFEPSQPVPAVQEPPVLLDLDTVGLGIQVSVQQPSDFTAPDLYDCYDFTENGTPGATATGYYSAVDQEAFNEFTTSG